MQEPTNQMDTSPAFSKLPDPDAGFGGAEAGVDLCSGVSNNRTNHYTAPSPSVSQGLSLPNPTWAPLACEPLPTGSSAGLYYGANIAPDNPLIQGYDSSLGIQNHHTAFSYTGQAPVSVYDVQNSHFQGNNNYGFAQGQQGDGNGALGFIAGYQHRPDLVKDQALTTGFDHQAQLQDARAIRPVFDVNPRSSFESPAFHGPGPVYVGQTFSDAIFAGSNINPRSSIESPDFYGPGPVYENHDFSDATFADRNVAGQTFYDPTDSSLAFSGPAYLNQPLRSPNFPDAGPSASMFSSQNISMNQYPAHQSIQVPAADSYGESMSNNSILPAATPAQSMQAALPSTQQSIQCTKPNCLMTFSRHADRIRHENTTHFANQGVYLCHVPGCPKARGKGYSRPDKLTEHLWKKHANLGFVKRV